MVTWDQVTPDKSGAVKVLGKLGFTIQARQRPARPS